ncbi:MAG TPA: PQQ-dependent sugar dehydrogenase, partial [Burkholderiaceae bacterium]|nr:PQQ-dependent sugar dehydrogenase [Burkholderiaceae bacterium]
MTRFLKRRIAVAGGGCSAAWQLGLRAAVAVLALTMASVNAQEYPSQKGTLSVTEVVAGLDHPWSMAFLPDNAGVLITERPGRLRLWRPDGGLSKPIAGLPDVYARSQGGLLDVALAPDFRQSRKV